jgi:hypothetical protein
MPLTVETATQAGQLATAITLLNSLMTSVQTAITNGVIVTQIDVRLRNADGSGDTLHGEMDFTVAESASIFNDVISIYQARLTDLNSQLTALVP